MIKTGLNHFKPLLGTVLPCRSTQIWNHLFRIQYVHLQGLQKKNIMYFLMIWLILILNEICSLLNSVCMKITFMDAAVLFMNMFTHYNMSQGGRPLLGYLGCFATPGDLSK